MRAEFLRKKYPKFIYEKYFWKLSNKNLEIFFDFKIEPNLYFQPKIIIKNVAKSKIKKIEKKTLNNLIFHLGLIEIPSYWKATCSPKIEILAGPLNKDQIKFWKDLIIRGMGQFFYENKIDFREPNFLTIRAKNKLIEAKPRSVGFNKDKILVPVGGGKDSVVTLEILKKAKKNIRCFALNPTKPALKIMKIAGFQNPIIVERKIDQKLLELNQKGFLNGHTPFSAYLAFLSFLLAVLFGFKYIAFSNERSSNEGNVRYLGKIINHQYSKSFDFEEKFRNYSKKYLAKGIEYFSFLRPLYEIQIAKLFSHYPKYFPFFISCNEAFKTNSGRKKPIRNWCCHCPKCLFVFATLFPFLKGKKLIKIFGQNLFKRKILLSTMLELIGEKKFKPFECVGTKKESLVSFYLSFQKANRIGKSPFLLKYFQEKILSQYPNIEKESKKILYSWNKNHNLPKDFEKILKKSLSTIYHHFPRS